MAQRRLRPFEQVDDEDTVSEDVDTTAGTRRLRPFEQVDSPPSVPAGFDKRVDESRRVSSIAEQAIQASREGLRRENVLREQEGKQPLNIPARKPRPEEQPPAQTARPEAAPPPPTEDDAQLRAAYAKIPRVPIEGGAAAEEVAFQKWKAARADAGRDKTISVEDKSTKYSKDIYALADSSEDTEFITKIHGKDSMLTAIQAASPTAYAAIMNTLGGAIQASGQVVDIATPIIQMLNQNEAAKNAINKAGDFLSPGRQVLTGKTDEDADRFAGALMATIESLDAMYMGGVGTVSQVASAIPRRAATSGALRSVGLEKAADRFAETGLRTRAMQAGKEYKSAQRKAAADARARARIEGTSPMKARLAQGEVAEQAGKLADEVAAENQDVAQRAIREFEINQRPDGWKEGDPEVSISTINKRTGLLEIDDNKVRELGKQRAGELFKEERLEALRQKYFGKTGKEATEKQNAKYQAAKKKLEEAFDSGRFDKEINSLTNPLLNPDKFNHIVSVASDLRRTNPELWDDKRTIIDNLFKLTVDKRLTEGGSKEIADTLNKFGLSFDDYVLTVVGTGSEAGKVLNRLSQIRRARPVDELYEKGQREAREMDSALKNLSQRIENIRRGGMVSQIATASRNLTSAGLRMPVEALQSVAETAMYRLGNEGVASAARALSPIAVGRGGVLRYSDTWKGAFAPLKHALGNRKDAKEYVDLLLAKPETHETFRRLFGNINEIQMLTGRGQATTAAGKVVDNVLSVGEDFVGDMNVFNRWQEFTVRRGVFLGQLENLTKREWGMDLIEVLNEGKINALLDGSLQPKGKRSFFELMEDSTKLALDITYAKQPETELGRKVASWITNASFGPVRATWVMPFPRFMVNAIELLGQYTGGASIPLAKKMQGIVKGGAKLTTKDRQRISRNLAGTAAMFAAYKYRTMEDAPEDYKMMAAGKGKVINTTPQFPMRQVLMIGEIWKQAERGDLTEWLLRPNNWKEISETFIGLNLRTGTGAQLTTDVVQGIESLIKGVDVTDASATEKAAKRIGRFVGGLGVSWLTPFRQFPEAQRALGLRGTEQRDVAQDPELGGSFFDHLGREIVRPFKQAGFGLSPEEEAALPKRPRIGIEGEWKKLFPGIKLTTGLIFEQRDSDDMEYLRDLGYAEWTTGSRSDIPTLRRFENSQIKEWLPEIVSIVRGEEERFKSTYKDLSESEEFKKKDLTEAQWVRQESRQLVNDLLKLHSKGLKQKAIQAWEGEGDKLQYLAIKDYRKLSKDDRRIAPRKFFELNGRWPDFTNAIEVMEMVEITKKGTGLGSSR